MANTTQTQRERVNTALYMLAAGADQDVLLDVLRTYVFSHVETTEDALDLLRSLARINPSAFTEALQVLAGRPLAPADDLLRKVIDGGDGEWTVTHVSAAKPKSKKRSKARKPVAKRPSPRRARPAL
jgi:hypothetical protein